MCFGCPSVARSVGGIPEVITDQATGTLVNSASADVLARAVENLITNPSVRRAYGLAAQQCARKKFSANAIVPRYEALYQRVRA